MKSSVKPTFAALLLAVAGCAVGPDYVRPNPPHVSRYTVAPLANVAAVTNAAPPAPKAPPKAQAPKPIPGGEAQTFTEGKDIPGDWWTLFRSPELNTLIERALKANPDIKAAQAALRAARENVLAQRGAYYPTVGAGFSASRNHSSTQLAPVPNANDFIYSLYTPQVTVSYTPDVFGLNRRTVEGLKAQAEQQRFALIATYVTLTANVVNAAINEASLRAQIKATTQLLAANRKALGVLQAQLSSGYAGGLDVAAEQSQLAQLEATLPPLLKQLAQQRDALAVMLGAFPNEDPAEKFEMSSLHLPTDLPVTIPAKLIEQRPDIRQAEENLKAANAQIGVAVANRLPLITLSANAGSSALALSQLFSSGTGFWSVAGAVAQPVFQGGQLMHRQRSAEALTTQAAEQYRSTVLSACQNVADTLNALQQDGNALRSAAEAEAAARKSFDLTQTQLQSGYANYLTLVVSETAYQQAVLALAQAQANRFSDTAALFQALGGGWWNRADLSLAAEPKLKQFSFDLK